MNRFTQVTFRTFFIVGVLLLYAIWFRLFWLNVWWGIDFTLFMAGVVLWAAEDSLHYDFTQED